MTVSAGVADLDAARDEFVGAYEDVPDPALAWLKPGDDYALGGIVIHVQNSADEYTATLQRLVDAGFRDTDYPPEDPAKLERVLARARAGIGMGERATGFMDLARSHDRLARLARGVPEFAFDRLVAVTYPSADAPYPTSARLIVEWMAAHYREHVPQVRDLLAAWRAQRG